VTDPASVLILMVLLYTCMGLLVAIAFVSRGSRHFGVASHAAGIGFRIIILPAAVALWPIIAARWTGVVRMGGR